MLAIALCAVLSAQLQETITVSRVVVDARVTHSDGEPVTDLTARDFEVRVDGRPMVVESAEWIADVGDGGSPSRQESEDVPPPAPSEDALEGSSGDSRRPGRLIVFVVQTDFARNRWRTEGQMKFALYTDEILETLAPDDRAAVFSFDSHLKFRLDFSGDREAIRDAIRRSIFIDHPPPPPVVPSPSLAARLDRDAMRRAASSEAAILLVANALRPISGPKSLLLLGWGLGQLGAGGVRMTHDWAAARAALDAARVSLFALDTTDADYHDLEIGLMAAAEQTGGFYAKTHIFPQNAIDRLRRTLSGHYELTLRSVGNLPPGTYDLSIRVKRGRPTVLAPASVWIRR